MGGWVTVDSVAGKEISTQHSGQHEGQALNPAESDWDPKIRTEVPSAQLTGCEISGKGSQVPVLYFPVKQATGNTS